jgi:lipid II:glycine glycyltransferase (peptidoglycan interpeptide bridge formation enzyme)
VVSKFYDLLVMTRRRHGLPVQPREWFRNIISYVGDKAKISIVSKDGQPIAGILTLRYKSVLTYKYGCSDRRFSSLGGTQLLLWNAIQEAEKDQLSEFDMGRTDCSNPGLAAFKDRWGAERTTLVYLRYPVRRLAGISEEVQASIGKYVWSRVPDSVLVAAGRLLYKYIG